MPILLKDIIEANTLANYGINELALIQLCQQLGVVANVPPPCHRCDQEMQLAKVKECDGFAWRCRNTVAVGHQKRRRCDTQVSY